MKTVMIISDATGETAERMVRAATLQFSEPVQIRLFSRVRLEFRRLARQTPPIDQAFAVSPNDSEVCRCDCPGALIRWMPPASCDGK